MSFREFERRVVDEKRELDEKLIRLSQFVAGSSVFAGLAAEDQTLLRHQLEVMMEYSDILGDRINRFS